MLSKRWAGPCVCVWGGSLGYCEYILEGGYETLASAFPSLSGNEPRGFTLEMHFRHELLPPYKPKTNMVNPLYQGTKRNTCFFT